MELKTLLSFILGSAVILFLSAVLLFQWLSRKNSGAGSIREYEELRLPGKRTPKQNMYHVLQQLYVMSERIPLLRSYLWTVRKRLTTLHAYDEWKLRLETIRIALVAWLILLIIAIPMLWFSRGDMLTLLMVLIGVWVLHGMVADAFIHRLEIRFLRQLRHFFADVRHHYHRYGMVEEAIYDATEAAPYEMALHGEKIYAVLTDSRPEDQLENYYEVAPNRFLKGLAGISHLVKEYGDKVVQNGSLYLKALGRLTTELNLDLLRREKLSYLLQGLMAIALVPILFTKPIEDWASHYFPAMDAFYASKLGWVTKCVILLIILGSYVLLRQMRELDGGRKTQRRQPWEKRVYELEWVSRIVDRISPPPGSKQSARMTLLLKEASSPLRLEWFTLQRITVAITAFMLSLGLFITLHVVSTHQLLHAPVQSDTMFGRLSPEEEKRARDAAVIDRQVIDAVKGVKGSLSEAILSELRKHPQLLRDEAQLHASAQRIASKLEDLQGEYLKWSEILLALLIAWGGYHAPVGVLRFGRHMRHMERKHEVDQLHTVIAMLAEMDRISVEQLLEWMERFSTVFKEPIQHCLLHYEHGAEEALEQLKAEAPFLPFVRTVEKLQLAVERIPIRQAFDDLESEQAFAQEQRKQEYEQLIETKAGWGRIIGFAPMMSLIFGYLVFPLVYVSLSQMTLYYEQIQRIQ